MATPKTTDTVLKRPKLLWENHKDIKCDFVIGGEGTKATCTAFCHSAKSILEVGNIFEFDGLKLQLTESRYNTENAHVYYIFNKKEGF
jgi:hypothetical protein